MRIPDAPWVGKCADEYYGYGESEFRYCAYCGKEYGEDELIDVDGELICRDCYEKYNVEEDEEEEDDEELHG